MNQKLLLSLLLLLLLLLLESFSYLCKLMIIYWSLSESKTLQVIRTLLSILTDLNNAVVSTVSTEPLISMSSNLFVNTLQIIPSAPITVGITVTFTFYCYFSSQAKSRYLSLFSRFFNFIVFDRDGKSTIWYVSAFFFFSFSLTISWSGCIIIIIIIIILYTAYGFFSCDFVNL